MTSQLYLTVLHKYMNCNVKWNGEKAKIDGIKICVIFEYEWNSRQFSGENGDWLSELRAGENILEQEKEKQNVTLRGLFVDSSFCYVDWIKWGRERVGEM